MISEEPQTQSSVYNSLSYKTPVYLCSRVFLDPGRFRRRVVNSRERDTTGEHYRPGGHTELEFWKSTGFNYLVDGRSRRTVVVVLYHFLSSLVVFVV